MRTWLTTLALLSKTRDGEEEGEVVEDEDWGVGVEADSEAAESEEAGVDGDDSLSWADETVVVVTAATKSELSTLDHILDST